MAARLAQPYFALTPRNASYHRLRRFLHAVGQNNAAKRMARLLTEETPVSPPERILSADYQAFIAECPFAF